MVYLCLVASALGSVLCSLYPQSVRRAELTYSGVVVGEHSLMLSLIHYLGCLTLSFCLPSLGL